MGWPSHNSANHSTEKSLGTKKKAAISDVPPFNLFPRLHISSSSSILHHRFLTINPKCRLHKYNGQTPTDNENTTYTPSNANSSCIQVLTFIICADDSFIAGTISGTTKCLVGHPFDTIKTRMQTNAAFRGPWECLTRTLKLEGVRGLYKVTRHKR